MSCRPRISIRVGVRMGIRSRGIPAPGCMDRSLEPALKSKSRRAKSVSALAMPGPLPPGPIPPAPRPHTLLWGFPLSLCEVPRPDSAARVPSRSRVEIAGNRPGLGAGEIGSGPRLLVLGVGVLWHGVRPRNRFPNFRGRLQGVLDGCSPSLLPPASSRT